MAEITFSVTEIILSGQDRLLMARNKPSILSMIDPDPESTIQIAHNIHVCIQMKRKELINPLSPHDALKHHFTYMKTYLISL